MVSVAGIILSVMHFFITKNNKRYFVLKQMKTETSYFVSFTIAELAILLCYIGMGFTGLLVIFSAEVLGQMAGKKEAKLMEDLNNFSHGN